MDHEIHEHFKCLLLLLYFYPSKLFPIALIIRLFSVFTVAKWGNNTVFPQGSFSKGNVNEKAKIA